MKITIKSQDDAEMIHAVIRMTAKEYAELHTYMHSKIGDAISFPYGSYITKRGRGWYRLIPGNSTRAIEKILFAVKVINRFLKEQEAKYLEEFKAFIPCMKDEALRITSFSDGKFGYTSPPMPTADKRPASQVALQALAAKFSKRTEVRT